MNWGYIPIGQNYSYDWGQPEDFIKTALDREMSLLKDMGVNTVHYSVVPPKWVTYIYKIRITTMINDTAGVTD